MSTEPRADPRYKWKVLGSVMFGVFMVVLDTTVVNVAFPTLRAEFKASLNRGGESWVGSTRSAASKFLTILSFNAEAGQSRGQGGR